MRAKPSRASATKPAGKANDASESTNAAPARGSFAEVQTLALALENKLARYGQRNDAEEYLAAARVVEALRLILATPMVIPSPAAVQGGRNGPNIDPRVLAGGIGKAASDLRSLAQKWGALRDGKGRYPDSLARVDKAACALRDGLAKFLAGEPKAEPAVIVEGLRSSHVGEGSLAVLPHSGTQAERIAMFSAAIKRLRDRTDGGRLDPEAAISACARVLGNRRELFGAARKRVKR